MWRQARADSHWSPWFLASTEGRLAMVIIASARAIGLSPGKGQKIIKQIKQSTCEAVSCDYKGF